MNAVYLVFWMVINGHNAMSVMPMPAAGLCTAVVLSAAQKNGTDAMCASEMQVIRALEVYDCIPIGSDETQDNYLCRKGR